MYKKYRSGAVGALLDEYERSIFEMQNVLDGISDEDLTLIVDNTTTDMNCKSIQTILTHVISSAYGYATYIHTCRGHQIDRPEKKLHSTVGEYIQDLHAAFQFTLFVFKDIHDSELEQNDNALKIKTPWDQLYDIEQLTEHSIVHILRHRRQIEKFKTAIKDFREKLPTEN
jgi:uncharacterized damage-inducible protein DinB